MEVLQPDSGQKQAGKESLKPPVKPKPKVFPKPSVSNKFASISASGHSKLPSSPDSPSSGFSKSPSSFATAAAYSVRSPTSPASPTSASQKRPLSPSDSSVSQTKSFARSCSVEVPSAQKINCLAGPRPYSSFAAGSTFIRRPSFRLGHAGSSQSEEAASVGNESDSAHGSVLPKEGPAIQRGTEKPYKDQPSPPGWQTKEVHPPVAAVRTSGSEYSSSNVSDRMEIKNKETVDGQEHRYPASRSGTDAKAVHSHSVMSSTSVRCEQLPPGGPRTKQNSESSTTEGTESEKLQDIKKPPLTERKQVSFKVKPVAVGQSTRRFPGTTVEEILAKIEQERVTPEAEKSHKMTFSFEQPSTFAFGQRASFRKKGTALITKVEESGGERETSEQSGNQIPEGLVTEIKRPESSVSDLTAPQSGETVQQAEEHARKDDIIEHQLQKEIPTEAVDSGVKGQKMPTEEELGITTPERNNSELPASESSSPELQQEESMPVPSTSMKPLCTEVQEAAALTSVSQHKPAETSLLSSRGDLDVYEDKVYTGSESSKPVQESPLVEVSKPSLPYSESEQQHIVTGLVPHLLDQNISEETVKHVDTAGAHSPPSLDQTHPVTHQSASYVSSVQEGDQVQNKQLIPEEEKFSSSSSADVLQEKEMLLHDPRLGRPLAHRGAKQSDSVDSVDSDWMLSNSFVWSPGSEAMPTETAEQISTESRLDTSEVPSQSSQAPLEFWIGVKKAEAENILSDTGSTHQEIQESTSWVNLSSASVNSVQTPDQQILNTEQRDHEKHETLEERLADAAYKDLRALAADEASSEDHNLCQSSPLLTDVEISATSNQDLNHSPIEVIDEGILTTDVLTFSPKSTTVTKQEVFIDNTSCDQTLSEVDVDSTSTEEYAVHNTVSEPVTHSSSEETSQPELFTAQNQSSFAAPIKTETSEYQPTNDINYKTENFEDFQTKELTSAVTADQPVKSQVFYTEEQNGIHISTSPEVCATKDEHEGVVLSNAGTVEAVSTKVPSQISSVIQSITDPGDIAHAGDKSSVSLVKGETLHITSTKEEPEKAADIGIMTADLKCDLSPIVVGILEGAPNDGQVYVPKEKDMLYTESMSINDPAKCAETAMTSEEIPIEVSQAEYPRETEEVFPSMMLLEPMRHVSQMEEGTVTKPSTVYPDTTDPNHVLLQSFTKDNLTEEDLSEIQVQTDVKQNVSLVSSLRTDTEDKKASFSEQIFRSQDVEGDAPVRQMDDTSKETTKDEDIDRTSGFINTVSADSPADKTETLNVENIVQDSAGDNQNDTFIRKDPTFDTSTLPEESIPSSIQEIKMEPMLASPVSQDEVISVSIIDEVSFSKTKEVHELESKAVINVLEPIEPVIKSPPPVEPCIMFQKSPVILEQATLIQDSLCTAEVSETPFGDKQDSDIKEHDKEKSPVIAVNPVQPINEEQREVPIITAEVLVHAEESPALATVESVSGSESPSMQERQVDSSIESQQLRDLIPEECANTERNIQSKELKMKELEESEHISPTKELQEHGVLKSEHPVPESTVEDVAMTSEETKETELEQKAEIMEHVNQENVEEVQPESCSPEDMPPSVSVSPQNHLDGLLEQEQKLQFDQVTDTVSKDSTAEDSSDSQQTESQCIQQDEGTADNKVNELQSEAAGVVSPSTITDEDSANQSDVIEGNAVSQTEVMMENVVSGLQPEKCGTVSAMEAGSEGQLEGEENVVQSETGDMDVSCASADQEKMDGEQEADVPEADFSFLQNVSVLNTTANRCRADLNRKRGHRTPVTPLGKDKDRLDGDDWIFRDSTEPRPARAESEDREEEEKEKEEEATDETGPKKRRFKFSKSLIFPKLDGSQKGKTRTRNKSEVEEKEKEKEKEKETGAASETVPFQRSKSFKLPSLTRQSKGEKEKGEKSERSSPQWLQALKLKKKSQNK